MPTSGPKYEEALARLPDEFKDTFKRLVEEYEFLTNTHYGRGYVAYQVLADLILAGWRSSAEPHSDSKL